MPLSEKFHLLYSVHRSGIWWRTTKYGPNGPGWHIKFPNARPLFSERNGRVRVAFRLFGFRLLRIEPDLCGKVNAR
jgi:hypothetical protein